MKKAESWNNVRVTFSIPKEAANRLKQLAQQNSDQLKRLGILSVQVEGDDIVRLSIASREGNIQHVVVHQQSLPLAVNTSALTHNPNDITHGNGPHEFDNILNQLTASHIQSGTSGYGITDQNVFVVPQPTTKKRVNRKPKEKNPSKTNVNAVIGVPPNGPANLNTNAQDILAGRMGMSSDQAATDTLGLSDMPNLDFNDLIGADGTSASLALEMVTDILHMDSMPPPQNPTLGMSPSSINSSQVQSQLEGPGMNSTAHSLTNTSDQNEVDDLFNIQLHSFETEDDQSTSHLTPSIGDLSSYSQDHSFTNASGPSPITSHAIQRQMSYPQYSSKQGSVPGPNSQGMFTAASGRQSVGPINTGLSSPHHAQHVMQNPGVGADPNSQMPGMMHPGNQKGNMIGHQPDMTGKIFPNQMMEKDGMQGFMGFGPNIGPGNPGMVGMQNKIINRQSNAPMLQQQGGNWKIPPGSISSQHPQHSSMHHSPGMTSPKPGMNVPMSPATGFNQPSGAIKRGYPGPSGVSQYFPGMQGQPPGAVDSKGMSMTSPLLVNLLQTSSGVTTTGTSTIAGVTPTHLAVGGEQPKPKRKKPPRRKKTSKNSYTPPAADSMMIPGPGMMPGQMPPHMSPQHGGVRLPQSQFGGQYGMQQVNSPSPGQYFHPHGGQPQMHSGMPELSNSMYGHFPNGNNLPSPGIHPMGNKASPSHVFSPDQKTSYIETINRSDVGSRLSSGTPTHMGHTRVPTPGQSPSGHGHITPNHMPQSSVGTNVFMSGGSGTVHHGPRMAGGMNGMQSHQMQQGRMLMSPGIRMQQQGMGGPNVRLGGPSPGMQTSPMSQQFPSHQQQQFQQHNPQFQSPPNMHANAAAMYNQPGMKQNQPNVMTSPSPSISSEFMQDTPPPNVVINGSDALQQAIASQRQQNTGFQKRGTPGDANIQNDSGGMQSPGGFFHPQANSSPSHGLMKNPTNPSMYYNSTAQMAVAGPNNFNNSNSNLESDGLSQTLGSGNILPLPTLPSSTASNITHCPKSDGGNMTEATVTHYPMSSRPKMGILDSGEMSILLKGSCNSPAGNVNTLKPFPIVPHVNEAANRKLSRQPKKSPGSVTDGHSSSPGSNPSHTPSPASVKRSISSSNPPTPLHLDPLGSPTAMPMQSHPNSRSTTPRPKSGCSTPRSRSETPVANSGTSRRTSIDRHQGSFPGPQQRGLHQGMGIPNGPSVLNRPPGKLDSGQHQYGHPYPNPGFSGPQGASDTSPFNQGHSRGFGSVPPAYSRDHPFSPHTQQNFETNTTKMYGPSDVPPRSPWGHNVPNHNASPSQINPPSFEEANRLQNQSQTMSQRQTMTPNSLLSHGASNHMREAPSNCVNSALTAPCVTSQSTDSPSPNIASVSDTNIQMPCRSGPSPHFFNNQAQDLIANSKAKQKDNPSGTTVPLQS